MTEYKPLLSTSDNPFNPHIQWDDWFGFDVVNGYNTCGLLARTTIESDSDPEQATLDAIHSIVKHNWSGKHIVVLPEDKIKPAS